MLSRLASCPSATFALFLSIFPHLITCKLFIYILWFLLSLDHFCKKERNYAKLKTRIREDFPFAYAIKLPGGLSKGHGMAHPRKPRKKLFGGWLNRNGLRKWPFNDKDTRIFCSVDNNNKFCSSAVCASLALATDLHIFIHICVILLPPFANLKLYFLETIKKTIN